MANWDYRVKITLVIIATFVVSYGVNATVVKRAIEEEAMVMLQEKARAITQEAENARNYVANLRKRGDAFDEEGMLAKVTETMEGATIHNVQDRIDAARDTTFYYTVPIVAGWTVGGEYAQEAGYEFRVPKIEPRNPKNEPTPFERDMLLALRQSGDKELMRVDEEANSLRFMRPILLSDDCMVCHGTIEDSITGTLNDPLGFKMENWKSGEMHGAFEVVADLAPVQAAVAATLRTNILWGLGLIPLSILVIMFSFKRFVVTPLNRTAQNIREVAEQVTMESATLSQGSSELAHRTETQAASLVETAASMEEVNATVKQSADNAVEANQVAVETSTNARRGHDGVQQAVEAMGEISESSNKISDIIKVIDSIAFQTNLLALNAAVEAARAGDAGAGFAVVAEEVRNLAQRSAQSAQEIKKIIEESANKVEAGNRLVVEAGETLGQVVLQVDRVSDLMDGIAVASREQEQGVNEVNIAVSQMDEITQQNVALVEEASASAEHLASNAKQLGQLMAEFGTEKDTARKSLPLQRPPAMQSSDRNKAKASEPVANLFDSEEDF